MGNSQKIAVREIQKERTKIVERVDALEKYVRENGEDVLRLVPVESARGCSD